MKQISNLTHLVVAFPEIEGINSDHCVDWAMEMAELGHDTPHLFMLAGITKPTNNAETRPYLKEALRELGLVEKRGEDAAISCCAYFVCEIAQQRNVRLNLSEMTRLGYGYDRVYIGSEALFHDFFLLSWAWGDLNYGNVFQDYWPTATLDNIEGILVNVAKEWIVENGEVIDIMNTNKAEL